MSISHISRCSVGRPFRQSSIRTQSSTEESQPCPCIEQTSRRRVLHTKVYCFHKANPGAESLCMYLDHLDSYNYYQDRLIDTVYVGIIVLGLNYFLVRMVLRCTNSVMLMTRQKLREKHKHLFPPIHQLPNP